LSPLRIGGPPEEQGAERLWTSLQREVTRCDPSAQMELSIALADGQSYADLPTWAKTILRIVWMELRR
jgi:hypothetical protein